MNCVAALRRELVSLARHGGHERQSLSPPPLRGELKRIVAGFSWFVVAPCTPTTAFDRLALLHLPSLLHACDALFGLRSLSAAHASTCCLVAFHGPRSVDNMLTVIFSSGGMLLLLQVGGQSVNTEVSPHAGEPGRQLHAQLQQWLKDGVEPIGLEQDGGHQTRQHSSVVPS